MMGKHRENTKQIITGADAGERDSSYFTRSNLDKYISLLRQIHFAIGTNKFCYWDKYILKLGQIQSRLLQVRILGREIDCTLQEAI